MLLAGGLALALTIGPLAAQPATSQDDGAHPCLPREECRDLKAQLRELRQEIRPLRRQLRELVRQIRELEPGDPRREELIEQARVGRQELRQLRRQRRPVAERSRHGCRPQCFGD